MMFTDDEEHFLNTNCVRFAELLTEIIPNINICTKGGTKLHDACFENDYDMVKMLVDKGIDIHIKNSAGKVAVYYTNDHDIIDLLFDSINETDDNNDTKLHSLIKSCQFDTAKYIIQKGARFDIKNSEGKTVKGLLISNISIAKLIPGNKVLSSMMEIMDIVSNIKSSPVTADEVVNMYNKLSEEDKIKVFNKINIVKGGPGVTGIIGNLNHNEEWVKVNVNDLANDTNVLANDTNVLANDTNVLAEDTNVFAEDTNDLAEDTNVKIDTDFILNYIKKMDISEQKNIASKTIDIIMNNNS